ncbi:MAG: elongation factor G [Planctomycetota bacterium]|nr:elongation factor G [Planctomycetota bacterium]
MTFAASKIRNIAFVGHPSAGKTTLIDAIAHHMGVTPRKGSVAEKTSLCDTEPEEQDKQHSLHMAVVSTVWHDEQWTFLDSPGYPDFYAEATGALYGADLVVGVVSCASGVTFNLRQKMEAARRLGRGRAILVTHLDDPNADFDELVEELRKAFGTTCVPYHLPDQSGPGFKRVRRTIADPESPWRQDLMDEVMDACEDEELMNRYLEAQEIDDPALKKLLPHSLVAGSIVPILICNPVTGVGISDVVEFFEHYAPGADEIHFQAVDGSEVKPDPSGELAGVVFNVKSDSHVGKVCIARIHRGTLSAQAAIVGPNSPDKGEKIGGLFRIVGKKREPIDSAGPGEIVAFTKVEGVGFGAAFTLPGKKAAHVAMPPMPEPMVAAAVQPKTRADEQKIGEALHKMEAEDPTFRVVHDPLTHEMVARGMSDLHLQIVESRLKRRYGVEITTHLPRIAYKETVQRPSEGHHRHKKQSGGRGQFGECYLRVKPLPPGTGFVFTDMVVGGTIPRNFIPAVEKGVREIVGTGVMTNSEVVDVEVELYDGKYHDVDSDEASFKIAGARAFRDGFTKATPVLLEPIMELTIHVPTHAAGMIFSDLTSHRRGHVVDQDNTDGGQITIIKAHAPLSAVLTYHRDLKSQSAGEGSYTMKLSHYAQVPMNEQQKVLAQYGKKHDDE